MWEYKILVFLEARNKRAERRRAVDRNVRPTALFGDLLLGFILTYPLGGMSQKKSCATFVHVVIVVD